MNNQQDGPSARRIEIMGPTASGKTALAIELHESFNAELISVDSAQVYRGMDIGTAKPDAETLARAPHRLIDIVDPWEAYSAARFASDAEASIKSIIVREKVPVLVGGTMLYFRALNQGLSLLPDADPIIRGEIEQQAKLHGWSYLHDQLKRVDPKAAAKIHCNDPQRIQRALEVYRLTGEPISVLQAKSAKTVPSGEVLKLVISPKDRSLLHRRIERRLDLMMTDGFVAEVGRLRQHPKIDLSLSSMRAVGYRQIWNYLDGEYDLKEARLKVLYATRQLAKRQLTWLRKETNLIWLDPLDKNWMGTAKREVERFLQRSV